MSQFGKLKGSLLNVSSHRFLHTVTIPTTPPFSTLRTRFTSHLTQSKRLDHGRTQTLLMTRNFSKKPFHLFKSHRKGDKKEPKRCYAFSVAKDFKYAELKQYFETRQEKFWNSELNDKAEILCRLHDGGEIFYIQGNVVCWGTTASQNEQILAETKAYQVEPIDSVQEEMMEYIEGLDQTNSLRNNCLFLTAADREQNLRGKLAFSYG